MNQKMSIHVRGNSCNWSFEFQGDPKYLEEWRSDGLEVFEIVNSIPESVVYLGLTKIWCFFEDLLHLKNPFEK